MKSRILFFAMSLVALLAVGCLVDPTEADPAADAAALDGLDQADQPAGEPTELDPNSSVEPDSIDPAAALIEPICFSCDLDPSVRACSTIPSRALHICNRACVVCDDFGDGQNTCFFGSCGPD
jgi:hypothetical protein